MEKEKTWWSVKVADYFNGDFYENEKVIVLFGDDSTVVKTVVEWTGLLFVSFAQLLSDGNVVDREDVFPSLRSIARHRRKSS